MDTVGVIGFTIGPGPASYLEVHENYNAGWAATLNGHALRAVYLDGWQQGFVVPAGRVRQPEEDPGDDRDACRPVTGHQLDVPALEVRRGHSVAVEALGMKHSSDQTHEIGRAHV